jgi:group I intron endonuclease
MGYIYLVTNLVTQMKYVGQTKADDVNKRWQEHKRCKKESIGRYLLHAYMKYGIDKFKYQIICVCFDDDCNRYEEEYIKKYNTIAPYGYNLKAGGHFTQHHPDTRALMSSRMKELMTDAEKKRRSDSLKGEKHWNYGKHISEEQKEKIRITQRKVWANMSPEERKKICEQRKERIKNIQKRAPLNNAQLAGLELGRKKGIVRRSKKIGKYDMNGNLLEEFISISHAARSTGFSNCPIARVCAGKPGCKTVGGFLWKFIE